MTVAQQTPSTEFKQPVPAPPRRNGRWSGYTHLLKARMLELKREPEVVFWVFVFPVLLALGLGIAFRNKPADITSIAIVQGPRALFRVYDSPENILTPARALRARPGSCPATRRRLARGGSPQ